MIGTDLRRWRVAAGGVVVVCFAAAGGLTALLGSSRPIRVWPADAATTSPATEPDAAPPSGSSTTRPTTEPAVRIPRNPAMSPGEWEAVVRFMRKNSPARLAFIRMLPDGPRRSAMAAGAAQDYRAYERARLDPDLSRTLLVRLKLEDDLFELAARLRTAPLDQQKQLSDDLRQKVGQWTDATFQERQQRIDRLERTLENQKQTLAQDQARRDVIVNERFHEVIRNVHLASTRPSTQPTPSTRP